MTSATGDEDNANDKHCSMLVLTRRPEETIFIGDYIRVTFLGMQNGSARIAIHAPLDIPVHREEIYRRIHSERAGESHASPTIKYKRRRNHPLSLRPKQRVL